MNDSLLNSMYCYQFEGTIHMLARIYAQKLASYPTPPENWHILQVLPFFSKGLCLNVARLFVYLQELVVRQKCITGYDLAATGATLVTQIKTSNNYAYIMFK